MAVSA